MSPLFRRSSSSRSSTAATGPLTATPPAPGPEAPRREVTTAAEVRAAWAGGEHPVLRVPSGAGADPRLVLGTGAAATVAGRARLVAVADARLWAEQSSAWVAADDAVVVARGRSAGYAAGRVTASLLDDASVSVGARDVPGQGTVAVESVRVTAGGRAVIHGRGPLEATLNDHAAAVVNGLGGPVRLALAGRASCSVSGDAVEAEATEEAYVDAAGGRITARGRAVVYAHRLLDAPPPRVVAGEAAVVVRGDPSVPVEGAAVIEADALEDPLAWARLWRLPVEGGRVTVCSVVQAGSYEISRTGAPADVLAPGAPPRLGPSPRFAPPGATRSLTVVPWPWLDRQRFTAGEAYVAFTVPVDALRTPHPDGPQQARLPAERVPDCGPVHLVDIDKNPLG